MKRLVVTLVLVGGFVAGGTAQTIITQWTFDGASSTTIPGGVATPTASTGTGTLQLIGGVTATFGGGTGSTDAITPTSSNFSWQTTGYPVLGTGSTTAGITIAVNTTGFHSLLVSFDQRLSSTSNDTWVVSYTADITAATPVWTTATVFAFTPTTTTGDTWYNQRTVDLSAVMALNDNPDFGVKIVSAFDQTTGNYLASASNKTYATTGNSRFDMVTVSGVADVIIQNDAPVAQNVLVSGSLNVGDTLHATYSYSDAEGDPEGTSSYAWFRADDAAGTNADSIETDNTKDYILTSDDLNKYIAFEVIPVAQTGTSPGDAIQTSWLGPISQSLDVLLYPQPFDLLSGNYVLKNWPAASVAGTFPPNMVYQQFNAEPSSPGMNPTALWECTYALTSHSRVLGLEDDGLAFLNTSDIQAVSDCGNGSNTGGYVGTAVLAIKTTGVANITLAWTASLVVAGNGTPARVYNLQAQYRIAGTSLWTSLGTAYEFSSASGVVGAKRNYSLVLPAAVENNSDVFIRWIYYQVDVGASGSRPEISLDDIAVTSPDAPNSAPVASALAFSGLELVNQIQKGSYFYADAEGDKEGASVFQWTRADDVLGTNAALISGANSKTYSTTLQDVGKFIAFGVQPVALTGTLDGVVTLTSYAGPVLNFGDPSALKINEVYSRGSTFETDPRLQADWVEFYNPSTVDITLAGLQICDSGPCQMLPQGASEALKVPAKGFLALSENEPDSFTFGLSSLGEYVVLKRPDTKAVIDSLNFPALDSTESYGRYTDGTSRITKLIPPTKGVTNNTAAPQDITTGLEESKNVTSVYPNPAHDHILVAGPSDNVIQAISLTTVTGQEILSIKPAGANTQIPMTDVGSGFYLMSLTYQNGAREIRKIIKE